MIATVQSAPAVDITFRNFRPSAALGPPADEYAVKLANLSTIVLGQAGQVRFAKYSPTPPVPKEFKDIMAAVAWGDLWQEERASMQPIFQAPSSIRHGASSTTRVFPWAPRLTSSWASSTASRSAATRPASTICNTSWTRTARTSWPSPSQGAASSYPAISSCPSAMPGRRLA